MRSKLSVVFSAALVLFFAWTLYETHGFRAQARLFPVAIGVAGLLLALLHLGLELRQRAAPAVAEASASPAMGDGAAAALARAEGDAAEEALDEEVPPAVRQRRTFAILGWVVAFALATWLLGFPLAVPLMTLAYLKVGAGESTLVSLLFAVGTGIVFYGLFVEAVRIPFEPGLLVDLLPI